MAKAGIKRPGRTAGKGRRATPAGVLAGSPQRDPKAAEATPTRTAKGARAAPKRTAKGAAGSGTTARAQPVSRKAPRKKRRARHKPAPVPPPPFDPAATRIIAAEADILEGVAALRGLCPVMRQVHDIAGHPPLRRREGGFEGLCRIIVAQQLSVASAAAIWSRTEALVAPFTHETLLGLSDAELAGAGLSRPKVRTLRAIAAACASGLDFEALHVASDEAVHAALTQVNGIGPWTADIYLMFCLGRADAWAPGDLALQIAAQQAFGLRARPDKDKLLEIAERWRPWRGVAARLLWSYYAVAKEKRQAIPV